MASGVQHAGGVHPLAAEPAVHRGDAVDLAGHQGGHLVGHVPRRVGSNGDDQQLALPVLDGARRVACVAHGPASGEDDGASEVPRARGIEAEVGAAQQAQQVNPDELGHRVDVLMLEMRAGAGDIALEARDQRAE